MALSKIVRGCDFSMEVHVITPQWTVSGQIWEEFNINECTNVGVNLICTKDQVVIPLSWHIKENTTNVIICDVQGKYLHSGAVYALEIIGLDAEGKAWRYKNKSVFAIVDATKDAVMQEALMADPLEVNAEIGLVVNVIPVLGPQGPQGDRGQDGVIGRDGAQGPKGDQGDRGIDGVQGPKGDQGDRGDIGPQGDKGDTGAQGDKGDIGPQGPQGEKGQDGSVSFDDLTPEQIEEIRGPQGLTGAQGSMGQQGEKGDTGAQGEKGDTGPQGEQGLMGEQGPQGEKGQDGSVSFDDLTPEQKEELRGPQGEKGDTGVQGSMGQQGEKGDTGPQGEQGLMGEQGPQGEKGDTGPQGEKGDTGAQGDKGDTGAQGSMGQQGDKGDTGAQGDKGDTGAQGSMGQQGDKGDAGAQGDKGDAGPQGEQGLMGEQGPQGDKGDRGYQGFQGTQGPKGEQGARGYTGDSGIEDIYNEAVALGIYEGTLEDFTDTFLEWGYSGYQAFNELLLKQDRLVSGQNIKTINNESILGSGNITIPSGAQGEAGIQGPQGNEGPQGQAGQDGQPGPQGDAGAQGPQGAQGPAGDGADIDVEPAKIVIDEQMPSNPDPDAVYMISKPININTVPNFDWVVTTSNNNNIYTIYTYPQIYDLFENKYYSLSRYIYNKGITTTVNMTEAINGDHSSPLLIDILFNNKLAFHIIIPNEYRTSMPVAQIGPTGLTISNYEASKTIGPYAHYYYYSEYWNVGIDASIVYPVITFSPYGAHQINHISLS